MNVESKFNNFSPCLVRLLARHKYGRPYSTAEIAATAAMSGHLVDSYSWRTDWGTITTLDALAFLRGCRLGIDDVQAWRRVTAYLNQTPNFRYLLASDQWESFYKPLLVQWRRSVGNKPSLEMYPPLFKLALRLSPLLDHETPTQDRSVPQNVAV